MCEPFSHETVWTPLGCTCHQLEKPRLRPRLLFVCIYYGEAVSLHRMRCKGDGYNVVWSFGGTAIVLRMELDAHCLSIDDDTEIAVVGVIVVFERQRVVDLVGRAVGGAHGRERRMAPATRDEVRYLDVIHRTRVTLV